MTLLLNAIYKALEEHEKAVTGLTVELHKTCITVSGHIANYKYCSRYNIYQRQNVIDIHDLNAYYRHHGIPINHPDLINEIIKYIQK